MANGGRRSMTGMIELLREEHRDIEQLLLVLEEELGVFDRQERPDYEVIQAVISYFQDYPDCCHHPKEDMLFAKLKERDPAAAESMGDLEAEHQDEARRLRRVADTIRSILSDHDVLRQTVDDVVRDFIAHQREHMKMEERVLYPAAAIALRAEDWAEIDSRWSDEKDSLFNVAMEERCHSLRDRVLQWEKENQEARI
jgi:hemerythrin-like domain-containing protein